MNFSPVSLQRFFEFFVTKIDSEALLQVKILDYVLISALCNWFHHSTRTKVAFKPHFRLTYVLHKFLSQERKASRKRQASGKEIGATCFT